jgi:hypothetical protein
MTQSKSLFYKALIFKHNEQWIFQNQSPKNSHACVPFKTRKIPWNGHWKKKSCEKVLRPPGLWIYITLMRIWILVLIKVMRIFDYWSKDPTKLHYEHIRLHCEHPWPSMGPFWTSLLLNRRGSGSGSSLTLQCGSGSGASFLKCGSMQIQICNPAYIPAKTQCNARHCEFSKTIKMH